MKNEEMKNMEGMENENKDVSNDDLGEDVIVLENVKTKKLFGRTYYYTEEKKEKKPINKKKVLVTIGGVIVAVVTVAGIGAVVIQKIKNGNSNDDGMTELPAQDAVKVIESLADKFETIGVSNEMINQANQTEDNVSV